MSGYAPNCQPLPILDPPHVFHTTLNASTLAAGITLPAIDWVALPSGATGSFTQTIPLLVPSIVETNANVSVNTLAPTIFQIRLLVDGVSVAVSSVERSVGLADGTGQIVHVGLNWGGFLNTGNHSIVLQYQNSTTPAQPPGFEIGTSDRAEAQGGQLTTTTIHFAPM